MIVGIGVDIIEIERIADARQRHGDRFVEKIFTHGEREYCLSRKASDQHFAVRWAAKEALMKAFGTGWSKETSFHNIEVVREGDAAPFIKLHGEALLTAQKAGITKIHLSLSHCRTTAIAQVVVEG